MTSIKLTSDDYSFHTIELKVHPDSNDFHKALKLLYAAAKKAKHSHQTTYPISSYQSKTLKPHFALSNGGEIPLDKKSVKLSFSVERIANSTMD